MGDGDLSARLTWPSRPRSSPCTSPRVSRVLAQPPSGEGVCVSSPPSRRNLEAPVPASPPAWRPTLTASARVSQRAAKTWDPPSTSHDNAKTHRHCRRVRAGSDRRDLSRRPRVDGTMRRAGNRRHVVCNRLRHRAAQPHARLHETFRLARCEPHLGFRRAARSRRLRHGFLRHRPRRISRLSLVDAVIVASLCCERSAHLRDGRLLLDADRAAVGFRQRLIE